MTNIKRYIIDKGYGQWKGVSQLFIIHYSLFFLSFLTMTACSDDLTEHIVPVPNDEFNGEKVLFSVGTTENSVSRAAGDGKSYYMPNDSRFVCRMYYKAKTGSTDFDVTGGSDQIAWLKVEGNVGNSLYWNKDYATPSQVDGSGNDYYATAFYWQNRQEHAFLAWTDLNHATSIEGGPGQNQLKFNEDESYKVYTGTRTEQWVSKGYELYGVEDRVFATLAEMQAYVTEDAGGGETKGESAEFTAKQSELETTESMNWTSDAAMASYHYQHGWQFKYSNLYTTTKYTDNDDPNEATKLEKGWTRYLMFFDKVPYDEHSLTGEEIKVMDPEHPEVVIFLKDPNTRKYIAAAELQDDGETYKYYLTDEDGNVKYDESNPKYTFYYKEYQDKENVEVVNEYPALAFDLTRGDKESMAEQPDIVQAREIQAPTGASQESNRVNLYFKHQFSQIQVNLRNAGDNSVLLEASDILKVELLGVTEKGYVFTDLDKDGNVKAAAYQEIDFSGYTEQQLKDNPYGTSFEMFDMAEPAFSYLKSYNAIAYGQLQAIRITWKEKKADPGDPDYVHAATFRIPDTELMNLKSGVRYVWNIEIRRGTIAVIRTEIVDWELPEEDEYNGSTDGTIQN